MSVPVFKQYLEHRVFMGDDEEPLSFIMCDARGIAKENQEGVARREIYRLIEGKLRHNDLVRWMKAGGEERVVGGGRRGLEMGGGGGGGAEDQEGDLQTDRGQLPT